MLKKIKKTTLTLVMFALISSFTFANKDSQIRDLPTGQQVFDLVISLEREPSLEEREKYEQILGFYADGLYEASNGKHLLGNIRIYQKSKHKDEADIVWSKESKQLSYANILGFSTTGKIYFSDVAEAENAAGEKKKHYYLNTESERKEAGYILTHESGHYLYGMCDEYKGTEFVFDENGMDPFSPQQSDTSAIPSVMNNQFKALDGNFAWLNFSTPVSTDLNNVHGRVYKMSGWEFLARSPETNLFSKVKANPRRFYFPVLAEVQPSETDTYTFLGASDSTTDDVTYTYMKVELDTAGPDITRAHLNPIWVEENNVDIELILDKSGSMRGTAIEDVKTASQTLLDFIMPGKTSFGVISFNNTATNIQPMVEIPYSGDLVIQDIKNIIGTISAGGGTAIYDAAHAGLDALELYKNNTHSPSATRFSLLLSDGRDGSSSSDLESVKKAYNEANVPLYTIHYGNASGRETLQALAEITGGKSYQGVTNKLLLWSIFRDFYAEAADYFTISNSENSENNSAPPMAPLAYPMADGDTPSVNSFDMIIDSSLTMLQISLSYTLLSGTAEVTIYDAEGKNVNFDRTDLAGTGGAMLTLLKVDADRMALHSAGTWKVEINAPGTLSNLTHDVKADSEESSYVLIADSMLGKNLSYPEPLLLTVSLIQNRPLTGHNLTGTITTPSGALVHVVLNDNGKGVDVRAADGIYSGMYTSYNENGQYTFRAVCDNKNANAVVVKNPGSTNKTPIKVTENFQRIVTMPFTISGMEFGQPDRIKADNSRTYGKIENPGSKNSYTITDIDKTESLFVRIATAEGGLMPVLTVYGDGVEIVKANIFTHVSKGGYVAAEITPEQLSLYTAFTARVENFVPEKAGDIYKICAGPKLIGDDIVPAQGIFKVETKDHHLGDPSTAVLSTKIENISNYDFDEVSLYYYFTADNGALPVIIDYYTPNSTVSLEPIDPDSGEYALVFNYGRIPAGTELPSGLENQVHLRHKNYEPMDKSNDYSNNRPMPWDSPWPFSVLFAENDKVAVYATISGTKLLLHGSTP